MSWYQQLKPVLLDLFGLSKDAIHIHIGFFCLIIFLLLSRRKLNSWILLLPGLCLSVILEILDLRDDFVHEGTFRFGASLHDLVNTNLIPFLLVVLAKRKKIQSGNDPR